VEFVLSSIQFPLFWAAVAVAVSGQWWAVALFLAAWAVRFGAARGIDRALGLAATGLATPAPLWLLPLRDVMSIGIILASYASDTVEWRGQLMHTRPPSSKSPDTLHESDRAPARQGTVLS
jgi:hypothetical protein